LRLFSFGGYGLALTALAHVVFGAHDSYPNVRLNFGCHLSYSQKANWRCFENGTGIKIEPPQSPLKNNSRVSFFPKKTRAKPLFYVESCAGIHGLLQQRHNNRELRQVAIVSVARHGFRLANLIARVYEMISKNKAYCRSFTLCFFPYI